MRATAQDPPAEPDVWVKTQAQLHAAFGIRNSAWAGRMLQEGAPPKDPKKGYNVTAWRKWRESRQHTETMPAAPGATVTHDADPGYGHLGLKKLYEDCRLAELKRLQQEGRLVDRESAVSIMQRHIIHCRVIQESIPDAIALLIADPEVREMVRSESRRIIEDSHRALAQAAPDLGVMEASE